MTDEHNDRTWQDSPHPHSGALAVIAAADADSKAHPGSAPRRFSLPWFKILLGQLLKFGLIGGLGIFVDLGVYTLLRTTILTPEALALGPMIAKVFATLVAILWSWLGNRFWTFRHDRATGPQATREGLEFLSVSLAGMVIGLIPLWLSHYMLGWTSLFVDNIANLIGIGLGSIFRFVLYRWWVYSPARLHRQADAVVGELQPAQSR
ncbi:GtrA family protein [Gulosibacter chungangensis]|uniref:GtrA family protein n=1 Tax=Gulosibacter chungangensis TaxID=979746 RepID=UPI001CE4B187|nr:GtrA family protein [Gulosibacter chungangensis]